MTRCLLPLCLLIGAGATPAVRVEPGKDPTQVRVVATLPKDVAKGLPAGKLSQDDGEAVLRLCAVDARTGQPGAAMLGAYERRGGELLFTPRFALLPGQRYQAILVAAPGKPLLAEYTVPPKPAAPPALVERVYPSADVLPANHLRFYIHFSRPMRGGPDIFEHIKILDASGKEITDAWLLDELWDAEGKVLILYIHPGRIKYGLDLRELLGPVLEPGREYTFVVGPGMLDADGRKLGKEFRKKFRTVAEDRVRVELSAWKVQAPAAGTSAPLVVSLPKALDRVGLESRLQVIDAAGKAVAGRVEVGAGEKSWSFVPSRPWAAAEHTLKVSAELEDPCGNTPTSAFDVDLKAPRPRPQPLTLSFRPTAQARSK